MAPPVATRLLACAGLGWGALLLTRPRLVADLLAPEYPADRDWVARVLGARLVVQDAALLAAPTRGGAIAAATVDGVHALSMLPWLGRAPYRRAAVISGAVAGVGALAAGALARR